MKMQFLALAWVLSVSAFAQGTIQHVLGRERQSLNGTWNILIDQMGIGTKKQLGSPTATALPDRLAEVHYEGDLTLQVPGDWNAQLPELKYYEGDIWYQKKFLYEPEQGQRVLLHFGAVAMHSSVYLNGKLLGHHRGGFTPFQFEVEEQLQAGVNNLIVRVDNRRSINTIPAVNFDWWNYGGITRDVDLVYLPETYIEDYTVRLNEQNPHEIYAEVQLQGDQKAHQTVQITLPEARFKAKLVTDVNGFASLTQKAKLELWSPSNPTLYDVNLSTTTDEVKDRIGFRTIKVQGEDILLNGQPLFLKGINIHEEIAAEERRACTPEDAAFLVKQAKELGCNFIRLSHYPHNEYMVRLAEAEGFLMWEEIPVWQQIRFEDPAVCAYAQGMMEEMIERDKNRCGIILWSISNETFFQSKPRNAFLAKLAQHTKSLDPSRLVTSALHMAKAVDQAGQMTMTLKDPLIEHLDVVGINKYVAWYEPFACAPQDLKWGIAPGKPVIMSEFGAECVAGNYEGDPKNLNSWSEPYMKWAYESNLASFANFPNLRGTAPWILFDFRSPRRPHAKFQRGWNRKGLISPEGEKKQAWYVMRRYYEGK